MKNLHLLPTEKQIKNVGDLVKDQYGDIHIFTKNDGKEYGKTITKLNIYITNHNYEFNQGWYFNTSPAINKAVFVKSEDIKGLISIYGYTPSHLEKIIITNDNDLIADGVQGIDDEFLEWFVKNPSCEEVKVKLVSDEDWSDYHGAFENSYYKIIIPKEEPKTNLERLPFTELVEELAKYYEKIPLVEAFKQETLEEATENNYPVGDVWTEEQALIRRLAFKNGAKWQINKQDEFIIGFLEFIEGTYSYSNIFNYWYLHADTSKTYTKKELLKKYNDTLNGN